MHTLAACVEFVQKYPLALCCVSIFLILFACVSKRSDAQERGTGDKTTKCMYGEKQIAHWLPDGRGLFGDRAVHCV